MDSPESATNADATSHFHSISPAASTFAQNPARSLLFPQKKTLKLILTRHLIAFERTSALYFLPPTGHENILITLDTRLCRIVDQDAGVSIPNLISLLPLDEAPVHVHPFAARAPSDSKGSGCPGVSVESIQPRPPQPCEVGRPKGRRRKNRRNLNFFKHILEAEDRHTPSADPGERDTPRYALRRYAPAASRAGRRSSSGAVTRNCPRSAPEDSTALFARPLGSAHGSSAVCTKDPI